MKYLIGIGNYSMYDDSIGLRLIEHIHAQGMEESSFCAIEVGGNLLNLLSYFNEEVEEILFMDAAKVVGLFPGEYLFFSPSEVSSTKDLRSVSTHEGDVMKVIELARETGYFIPPMTIMGVAPLTVKSEIGLSPLLQAHTHHYARVAIEKLLGKN